MKDAREARARDYMSSSLVTLDPGTDVLAAMRTLLDREISAAPVLDGHGSLVGILTQRDCLQVGLHGIYHQEPGGHVADYSSRPVETVSADDTLIDLIEKFRASPHRCFPVMDGTRVVGVLSRGDVLRAILELW